MKHIRLLLLATAAACLYACSASNAPSGVGLPPIGAHTTTATATFAITIPTPPPATIASANRSPMYISYRVQSVAISGSGVAAQGGQVVANVTTGSPSCTGTPLRCLVPISATVATSDTFTVTAYDATNATGNVLSTGTVTQAVNAGAANTIAVTLNPLTSFATSAQFANFVTAGPDGNLWFTEDGFFGAIDKLTPAGTVTQYTNGGTVQQPYAITAGPDGNLWFTASSGTNAGKVIKSDTNGNMTVYGGTLKFPSGIATGPDGNLWVAELGYAGGGENGAIAKITTTGVITQYTAGTIYPLAITAGPDGNLWYTDVNNNAIGKVTTSGVVTVYGAGTVSNARSITAGPDGNVWFTENGAIGKITPTGAVTTYGVGLVSNPNAIAAGPDGNLWFVDQGNSDIGTVAPSTGVVTEYGGFGSQNYTNGIAFGADGNLWIAGSTDILRFIR